MAVKCPHCGTENLDGALFCDECGASLAEAPASQQGAGTAGQGTVDQRPSIPPPSAPTGGGTVQCPTCHHENPANARFCENCGGTLTAASVPPPEAVGAAPGAPAPAVPVATLVIADSNAELPLDLSKGEALIGRADPVSRVYPDVDLTPHGGYEAGVSRRHCRIFRQGDQFFVEDLGSTNGTKVNGQPLPPNQPRALSDGDVLELGLLRLTFRVNA